MRSTQEVPRSKKEKTPNFTRRRLPYAGSLPVASSRSGTGSTALGPARWGSRFGYLIEESVLLGRL